MAEGKRPGGLTALAVINFIGFAGNGIIGLGMLALGFAYSQRAELAEKDPKALEGLMKQIDMLGGPDWIWAHAAASAVLGVLLLIAGIGYLKQKRVIGRQFGTGYAVLSIGFHIALVMAVGLKFEMLINFVYPVITLILLNTMFKDDLVN